MITEVEKIEKRFEILQDSPDVYDEWKRLVTKHRVVGTKVHDAKLVALMNINRIRRILTFNDGDFKRYGVEALHPSSVPAL